MVKPGVIVLGGHVQALGILRILGKLGLPGIVVDSTAKNIARHSRYCNYFRVVKDDDLLDFLIMLGKDANYSGWLIFPTNDFHVHLLSNNKSRLEEYFVIAADSWESVSLFYNKRLTYKLAEELNIPIANTFFPDSIDELKLPGISFPCIIKPAVMFSFYKQVKRKVFLCRTYDELVSNYRRALKVIPASEIIVQEIIEGPGINQFSACFLFLDGQNILSLTVCRMRQHPLDFGNATTYAETVDLPELIEMGEKILKAAGYNGLCEVEFKKDERDGLYKFLEVNTRTWKWHTIAEKAGIPFLQQYYEYLTLGVIPSGKRYFPLQASFRHSLTDLYVQFRMLTAGQRNWNRLKKPVQHAVWDKRDILPWIYEKIYFLNLLRTR
ncbi:MAG: hypothetical protein IH598_04725 [Bacteroidales bacterium]|nr:hypothetical protein [Bacteroidales bacterium]